jgi:hypothetical protein
MSFIGRGDSDDLTHTLNLTKGPLACGVAVRREYAEVPGTLTIGTYCETFHSHNTNPVVLNVQRECVDLQVHKVGYQITITYSMTHRLLALEFEDWLFCRPWSFTRPCKWPTRLAWLLLLLSLPLLSLRPI